MRAVIAFPRPVVVPGPLAFPLAAFEDRLRSVARRGLAVVGLDTSLAPEAGPAARAWPAARGLLCSTGSRR